VLDACHSPIRRVPADRGDAWRLVAGAQELEHQRCRTRIALYGVVPLISGDPLPRTEVEHNLTDTEKAQLLNAADIVTMARPAVERDFRGDIVFAHDPEMPTRFAKQLVQMLRGAVAIGMTPADGMRLALRCARDSIPLMRREILLDLAQNPDSRTADVRKRISKPRNTVRRELECLHMLQLLRCDETQEKDSQGKEYTVWRYRLDDDFDVATLKTMADPPPETKADPPPETMADPPPAPAPASKATGYDLNGAPRQGKSKQTKF
jgi:hypothetical protein